jgi:predicted ATPase
MLAREPVTTALTLEPLTRADVALYLEQVTLAPPSPIVTERVFEKTQGHPLLLAELAPMLRATQASTTEVSTSALVGGQTMRAAIDHELALLPEATLHTLRCAAVFGSTFSLAPLAAALDVANAAALRDLDVAEAARVVTRGGSAGAYRFTYPLVRDVLYKQLPVSERARLHALVAGALEDYAGGAEQTSHRDAGEIARHWVEAAALGEVDRALDWSLRAAGLAQDCGDHAAASTYAERGLRALPFAKKPDAERRARLVAACKRP